MALLVNTDAFTEPARHFIAGECQRNRVAKFVPENALPIRWRGHLRGRAIGCDNTAKTHAKKTRIVRHTESAYAEIFLFGEDFHRCALLELEAVFLAQRVMRTVEQAKDARTINGRLVRVHADDEIGVSECSVFTERIA